MKALVLKERGIIEYVEKDYPCLLDDHGVILKPIYTSPCTSDVHTIWQGSPKRKDLTLGHECVAEVVRVGKDVRDFKQGDIVAVPATTPDWGHKDVTINPGHAGVNFSGHLIGKTLDGAFQEAFYLPYADKNLAHIPEGVSLIQALMCVDVVSTGFTAAEEANIKKGDSVVVFGIGAIGLAAIMGAKYYGASKIYAVGSRYDNTEIAKKLGAEVINYKTCKCDLPKSMHPLSNSTGSAVVNYILSETDTKGVDAVLICGGDDSTFPQAVDVCKYGTGVVSNIMYYGADLDIPENEIDGIIIPKFSMGRGMAGKTLKFSLVKGGRERLEFLLELCKEKYINPEIFVTREYDGIDKIIQAIYDMKNRDAIKIAIRM
ncbi:MAG: zinc-binding dehydrogenase [Lachnospiraceae bacterium]|nr:zinc-binding dehydrogenase [Lachnospiraceae bacterium]